jgi:hypothetical protein
MAYPQINTTALRIIAKYLNKNNDKGAPSLKRYECG